MIPADMIDLDSERGIIAAVAEGLPPPKGLYPAHFFHPVHAVLYLAACECQSRGKRLSADLADAILTDAGMHSWLPRAEVRAIVETVPADYSRTAIRSLRALARRREIRLQALRIAALTRDPEATVSQLRAAVSTLASL